MYEYTGKKLTIMACSKCNTNCKHCYISYVGNRTPEELKELVLKFSKKYKVEINGSEILTDPRYIESYPIAKQDFIMTNGIAIYQNQELLDYLIDNGIKQIFMSYHFGIQNEISSVAIDELEVNIKNIIEKKLKLKLYTTITTENYKLIHDIINNAVQYGAMSVRFTNYIKQGNAINLDSDNVLNNDQIEWFLHEVNSERNKYDQDFMDIERCGSFGPGNSKKFRCYAIEDNIVLTPDNNIYPCLFLAKPGYEIGYFDGERLLIDQNVYGKNDGEECIAKEHLNNNNGKILQKKVGKRI
ncbi:MAG: radical SAM protein [Firmicutes bacterium]|nr:radical SAM protein [Bacillota bacterium]